MVGTKSAEFCAQHAPDGMISVKSRKCRTEGCGKKPPFGMANTRTAEHLHSTHQTGCGVEGYREGEVDPHHSGKETIGNMLPKGAEHESVYPAATTSPPLEVSQGARKRVRHSEIRSTVSMRPIPRKSAGRARTMLDIDGQKYLVKRNASVKAKVLLSF